jgi:hypothetical protein
MNLALSCCAIISSLWTNGRRRTSAFDPLPLLVEESCSLFWDRDNSCEIRIKNRIESKRNETSSRWTNNLWEIEGEIVFSLGQFCRMGMGESLRYWVLSRLDSAPINLCNMCVRTRLIAVIMSNGWNDRSNRSREISEQHMEELRFLAALLI